MLTNILYSQMKVMKLYFP